MDMKGVTLIVLAQDMDKWQAFVTAGTKSWVA